jgi:hypothetical protein
MIDVREVALAYNRDYEPQPVEVSATQYGQLL